MIRKLGIAAVVVVVALVLALASVWWALLRAPSSSQIVTVGPWQTSLVTGSVDADIYARARIAIGGLFALNRAEAIYFGASQDDDHKPLRARCSYLVEGRPVAARWWSVTAYADDHFLIPNVANRFSYNMGNLKLGPDGTFRVTAGPTGQSGHWLPTGDGSGGFNLLFRLYNPAPEIAADPGTVRLPSIKQIGACP
jgi:hypothetical protein